ncbi:MAG TPA: MBL fold metallo-hydrolase [Gemmatimonadaceae bacterium]|nr:MBL fold metallo-hydrolase [Gemmatimonadaceae bacterium]
MSRPPHHTPTGFRNPWPGAEPRSFRDVFRWSLARWKASARGELRDDSRFERATPSFARPRAEPHRLAATWVGHSTVLVQAGGLNILTDPMWSARASPLPWAGPERWVEPGVALDALPPLDLVLVSHNHYDHLDDATVRQLAARHPEAAWVAPLGLERWLRGRGARAVTELDWWEETRIPLPAATATATVTATPAQHFSARGLGDRMRTLWCGFAVAIPLPGSTGARRIFFAGDTGFHPEWRAIGERLGPFDLSLIPVGAYEPRWFMRPVHMNPEEAVDAFLALHDGARADDASTAAPRRHGAMLPIHWGTFKLTDERMDEPPARTRSAWTRAGLDARELWVMRHGETREC